MSYIRECADEQLVKDYTSLMMTCEPKLSILMAQVPIDKTTTNVGTIASAIREWCFVGVKSLEGSMYPGAVEEVVEDRLTITEVGDSDTSEALINEFHKAIRWNTPAK